MTALTKNTDRKASGGIHRNLPVLASNAPFQGSLIGIDGSTGYARALVSGDKFAGIAIHRIETAPTASGDKKVEVVAGSFTAELTITSVAITDIGKLVYATDDNAFTLTKSGSPIGIVVGYVGTNTAKVECHTYEQGGVESFLPACMQNRVWEDLAGPTKTLDIQDVGKVLNVTGDCVITLPATAAGLDFVIRHGGVDGSVLVTIDPAAADKIMGADLAGVDDKDRILTEATANNGDFIHLTYGGAAGYLVIEERGTWAAEA